MTNFGHLDVQPATPAEANVVLDVLDEAAAWLSRRGIQQWPPSFRREWLELALSEGRVLLARLNGVVAGTVTVDWADPFWADDRTAGYIHHLALRRAAAGLGTQLRAWSRPPYIIAGEGSCGSTARQTTRHCGPTTSERDSGTLATSPCPVPQRYGHRPAHC